MLRIIDLDQIDGPLERRPPLARHPILPTGHSRCLARPYHPPNRVTPMQVDRIAEDFHVDPTRSHPKRVADCNPRGLCSSCIGRAGARRTGTRRTGARRIANGPLNLDGSPNLRVLDDTPRDVLELQETGILELVARIQRMRDDGYHPTQPIPSLVGNIHRSQMTSNRVDLQFHELVGQGPIVLCDCRTPTEDLRKPTGLGRSWCWDCRCGGLRASTLGSPLRKSIGRHIDDRIHRHCGTLPTGWIGCLDQGCVGGDDPCARCDVHLGRQIG